MSILAITTSRLSGGRVRCEESLLNAGGAPQQACVLQVYSYQFGSNQSLTDSNDTVVDRGSR
jgi:hypothetical protein